MNMIYILSFSLFLAIAAISIEETLDSDKMYILIGEQIFLVNIIENEITRELISILPLRIKLNQENIQLMQMKLSVQIETPNLVTLNNQNINAKKGDMFLFEGKEIVIFKESAYFINENSAYIKIGFLEKAENFFNLVKTNKTIFLWNILNYENHKGKFKPYGFYNNIMNYFTWKIFTFFCFLLL